MHITRGFFLMALTAAASWLNCRGSNVVKRSLQDTSEAVCNITVDVKRAAGSVSPLLMGFNIIYNYSPDDIWRRGQGKVPLLLERLNTGILRYPGGTVTTFYHWEDPIGRGGHKDSWDPSYDPSKNSPPASMMDLDEYLDVCRALHTEPLIGINMGSGMKYHRVEDGIGEAVRLMKHCIQRGFRVKYFYLDNEPYQHDANFTYTAVQYADMINQYADAMRKVDRRIRIIANTKPVWRKLSKADLSYTKTLISKAGRNIDFLDVHDYWAWGHATYASWKNQIPMQVGATGISYRQQRSFYRNLAASMGHPGIDMISLEWNIGPPGRKNTPPTQAEAALMIAEQFMQMIGSGMKIAAFWPVYWPKHTYWSSRALLDAPGNYEPNKVYAMFDLYKSILGQEKVMSSCSDTTLETLSVKSVNEDTLWIYMINKDPVRSVSKIKLHIDGFHSKQYDATGFRADDNTGGPLKKQSLKIKKNDNGDFLLAMQAYSFARVTLIK